MPQIQYTSLEIVTPSGRTVPNHLLKPAGPARSLMVVFPGLNYSCDNPLLYYISRLAVQRSADVLQLWARYTDRQFQSLSEADQLKWLLEDARSLIEAARKNGSYERLVLVGKSIGTLTLAALFDQARELSATPAIWLTPLFHQPAVLKSALHTRGRALFIDGSADPSYDAEAMQQVELLDTAQVVLIQEADHSLEIAGDLLRSLKVLRGIVETAASFLDGIV